MTPRPQDQVSERVATTIAAFGGADKVNASQLSDIRRVAELEVIADACRQDILSGSGTVQLADLVKAEQIAADARGALRVPEQDALRTLEIRFVGHYTNELDHAEHKRIDDVLKRISEINPENEASTAEEALLLVERLRMEVRRLTEQLAKAHARITALASPSAPETPADNVVAAGVAY